jgi:uncharacterized membrane protein YbaN (DUF454 family)
MSIIGELQISYVVVGILLAANVLAMVLFILYAKLPVSKTKETIRNIIFELDRFADNMENAEKRRTAIQQINDVLGWRKFIIPGVLIGWVIDAEVAAIRKMQQTTDCPNLHEESDG